MILVGSMRLEFPAMDFGQEEGEARQALSHILRYGFTHICFVGRPQPSMTYLRR